MSGNWFFKHNRHILIDDDLINSKAPMSPTFMDAIARSPMGGSGPSAESRSPTNPTPTGVLENVK